MYYASKVLGQIFANPPYHILRCLVAHRDGAEPIVVKGKIAGPTSRGSVFTFQGKKVLDKRSGKHVLEVVRTPINPKFLEGSALTHWAEWSNPEMEESVSILSSLSEAGVSVNIINSVWSEIEGSATSIKENPWLLVYKGVSFKSADDIARTLLKGDFDPHNLHRVEASIFWSLLQGVYKGHCHLDSSTVFSDATILTGLTDPKEIALCIKRMCQAVPARAVVETSEDKSKAIYLPSYHRMEVEVADFIRSPLRGEGTIEVSDEDVRSYTRYDLTETQVKAIKQGLKEPFSIVTGLPGTGKTTILNTLCKILKENHENILIVAPTGIAAKRASNLTGLPAQTIHRAFGSGQPMDDNTKDLSDYEGIKKDEESAPATKSVFGASDPSREVWKFSPMNPRDESVVIVDEASMVDLHLMWRLMRGISPKCRVVMVGDIAQLPPVGAGFVLSELIKSGKLPQVHLSEVFRQGKDSEVTMAAHSIHAGKAPKSGEDFVLMERQGPYGVLESVLNLAKELHMDEVDFHILSPTHHGQAGVTNLNKELRAVLNPDIGGTSFKIGSDSIRVGDKVMITKNEYELGVFNGDVGKIRNIDKVSVEVVIKGVRDIIVDIPKDAVGRILRLAYATTVHKSQGLEYDVIIMPILNEHGNNLLQRPLLYTAVTRAKQKVYLVGHAEAVEVASANATSGVRYCRLHSRFV
jgi:exodeoxyribonuclease V alpha subunit